MQYIDSAVRQFKMYRSLGEKAMAQLTHDQLFWEPVYGVNSIAVIVRHLHGNMLSRWTNFLTEDGEKPWRKRDAEFQTYLGPREQLEKEWREGWDCLLNTLHTLTDADLEKIVYIRNEGHTVLEAINRQISHYCYHVGQIVLLGKMAKAQDWQTLSIARGKSDDYNAGKFSEEKKRKHFTEDFLSEEKNA